MPTVPTPHDHALPAETLDEKDARLTAEEPARGRTLDSHLFADLAATVTTAIHDTPVRLGHPEGAADLAAQLTVKTAAYIGSILPTTPGLARFMAQVDRERARQLAKFGDQRHPDMAGSDDIQREARGMFARFADDYRAINDGNLDARDPDRRLDWTGILLEEVFEALAETDPVKLRAELVQVAAVCQAWVSDLDRRESVAADDEHYPTRLGVYCDFCGATFEGDFIVSDAIEEPERLEIVRAHVRTLGWSATAGCDHACPTCVAARADL